MSPLAAWQDDFAAALRGGDHPLAGHPAFAVYRNTVWKGWIDALEANYPAVAALTGAAWLRGAAASFAEAAAPSEPMISRYGEGFPKFLETFPPAQSLPFLADVARLDRAWTDAHLAPDAASLPMRELAALDAAAMARTWARPHPSVRAFWFDTTIATLWLANRPDFAGGELILDDRPEGLLVARPRETVEVAPLDVAGFAFLDACCRGRPLLAAATAALAADAGTDLGQLLATLVDAGVFAEFVTIDPEITNVAA